jgi:hypothetical protein
VESRGSGCGLSRSKRGGKGREVWGRAIRRGYHVGVEMFGVQWSNIRSTSTVAAKMDRKLSESWTRDFVSDAARIRGESSVEDPRTLAVEGV